MGLPLVFGSRRASLRVATAGIVASLQEEDRAQRRVGAEAEPGVEVAGGGVALDDGQLDVLGAFGERGAAQRRHAGGSDALSARPGPRVDALQEMTGGEPHVRISDEHDVALAHADAGTIETLFAGWEMVGLSSALLVAFVTGFISLPLQWCAFFVLSSAFILLSRRLLPKPSAELEDSARDPGVVTVTILPGGTGRVAFQGTTWNARSEAADRELPPGTQVIVVAQKGNMLSVVPIDLLKS